MFSPPPPPSATKEPVKDVSPKDSFVLGIGFAWELGYTIAVPAVLFGIGGAYVDKYLDLSPLFLLIGMILACVISFSIIADKLRIIAKRMPKDLPRKVPVTPKEHKEQEDIHDLFRPPHS